MSWARVDDGWWSHPKVMTLTLASRGLWISALSWSCQHQTDYVPSQFVAMAGDNNLNETYQAADELVDAGLWVEVEGGWRIHDWDDYQSERAKKVAAGRAGGRASGAARRGNSDNQPPSDASTEAEPGASHEADDGASTLPDPKLARPDPLLRSAEREQVRDALLVACEMDWDECPAPARAQVNTATKALLEVGVSTDEIAQRAAAYRARWPTLLLTPMALVKHWPQLARSDVPTPALSATFTPGLVECEECFGTGARFDAERQVAEQCWCVEEAARAS